MAMAGCAVTGAAEPANPSGSECQRCGTPIRVASCQLDLATSNGLFRNLGNGRFDVFSESVTPVCARGCTFADIDVA